MFYKGVDLSQNEMERSFKLVENFFRKLPRVLRELENETIAEGTANGEFVDERGSLHYRSFFNDSFVNLSKVLALFKFQRKDNSKQLFMEFEKVGLTGDIVNAKFMMLDSLYFLKTERSYDSAINKAINPLLELLKSILKSICNGLGYKWSDIFEEGFDLIKALREVIKISKE